MKLGLGLTDMDARLRMPVDQVRHAERLGFEGLFDDVGFIGHWNTLNDVDQLSAGPGSRLPKLGPRSNDP